MNAEKVHEKQSKRMTLVVIQREWKSQRRLQHSSSSSHKSLFHPSIPVYWSTTIRTTTLSQILAVYKIKFRLDSKRRNILPVSFFQIIIKNKKIWRSRKALSQHVRNAVLFWLKSFIKSSSLALVGGEKKKICCPTNFPFVLQLLLTFVYLHCRPSARERSSPSSFLLIKKYKSNLEWESRSLFLEHLGIISYSYIGKT